MATPVKDIEKEFLLRVMYDDGIPVTYYNNGIEYNLFLKKPAREEMVFLSKQPIIKLKMKDQLELAFDYRGKAIAFNVEALEVKEKEIICTMPNSLYKDLDRSYSRISIPERMQIQFSFLGDRYNLSFPKIMEYDAEDLGDMLQNYDPRNFSALIEQMSGWIKKYATGHRLVLFNDIRPSTTEERVIAETGKTLFLPSTSESFPKTDPFPRKRIITEDMFKRYLESTGIGLAFVNSACSRFVKAKADSGTLSDAWIPILFHEFVIGYLHVWNDAKEKPLFDYVVIDTLYQFTKVLAYSLEINGYFDKGKIPNTTFDGKIIDISASGLLFAYPYSNLSSALMPESKLVVKISTPQRTVAINAIIVRRFKDKSFGYYGCRFEKMEDEDFQYLFEFIYGRPFTSNTFSS